MHLHTDVLRASDLRAILRETGLSARGVGFDPDAYPDEHGSRKRTRRIDFKLVASPGYGRRYRNSGTRGAESGDNGYWEDNRAPLYDEWGAFLGEVFHRDPDAVTNYYDRAGDFVEKAAAYRHKSAPGGDVKRDAPTSVDAWRNLYRPCPHRETAHVDSDHRKCGACGETVRVSVAA
jgi:hypothetical protein